MHGEKHTQTFRPADEAAEVDAVLAGDPGAPAPVVVSRVMKATHGKADPSKVLEALNARRTQ